MDSYFGYKPCSCCGKYADDGTYAKDSWYCLDCADKRADVKEVKQFDDLRDKQLEYPSSVFSHETAVMLHTLSTYSPFYYHISFPEGYHLLNAREQYIKPHYPLDYELNNEYIEVMDSWHYNPIRVTNLEKTIIDMLRYKRAMPGIVDEMINDYIVREVKDVNKLVEYAYQFDVLNIVKKKFLPFIKGVE